MQKLNIIYAGTPEFAVPALQSLIQRHRVCAVFTQPDKPAGRGRQLTAPPVKQVALEHDIPVHQPISLKNSDVQQLIADYQADVMVVAAYGLILPEAVLALPLLGCLNIHASWLPRWRGAAPIQRAILAGDTETGISIMHMAKGLDTGDVCCLEGCLITERETSQSLHDKLSVLGAEAILDALQQIIDGTAVRTPQQENLVTYADKITKVEAKLNWQHNALLLDRTVRAFYGWPVAYTNIDNQTLRVWQAEPIAATSNALPGTIIGIDKHGIDVATGKGVLRLLQIQWPGKKRIAVKDALNAQDKVLTVGKQFS